MKKIIICLVFIGVAGIGFAQSVKYKTTTGNIGFSSKATMEDIDAKNDQVIALLDATEGKLAFKVLIKSFEFEKSLMQTHFNDNYMQSDTYPSSTFDGKITNNSDVNYSKNGTYNVTVTGKLTIHGVTKEVTSTGTATVSGANVTLKSSFTVKLEDYGIKNDKANYLSSNIEVNVNSTLAKQ